MEEAWQEARAMIEYARDSEDGLVQIESRHNRAFVKEIVRALVKDEMMDPLDVFRRILPCSANVVLLEWFREEVLKGPAWLNLVDDIVRQPEGEWEEFDLSDMLPSIFGDSETIGHLLTKHRDVMRDPDSIFSSMDASRGWVYCIRYHIANSDERRAWDEIKRAQKGLFNKDYDHLVEDGVPQSKRMKAYANPAYRLCQLGATDLKALVRELYAKMYKAGHVYAASEDLSPIHYSARVADNPSVSVKKAAGWSVAKRFMTSSGTLSEECVMTLCIAEYFLLQSNERRRMRAQERARIAEASYQIMH